MPQVHHPNAWLSDYRNVQPGLVRRTEILQLLEQGDTTAKRLASNIGKSYSTILHHLHQLEIRRIVGRANDHPPIKWRLNPVGQQILDNY